MLFSINIIIVVSNLCVEGFKHIKWKGVRICIQKNRFFLYASKVIPPLKLEQTTRNKSMKWNWIGTTHSKQTDNPCYKWYLNAFVDYHEETGIKRDIQSNFLLITWNNWHSQKCKLSLMSSTTIKNPGFWDYAKKCTWNAWKWLLNWNLLSMEMRCCLCAYDHENESAQTMSRHG